MTWMIIAVLVVAAIVIAVLLFGERFRYRMVRLTQDRRGLSRRRRGMADR